MTRRVRQSAVRRRGETYVSSRFRAVQKTRPHHFNVTIRLLSAPSVADIQSVLARNRSVRDLIVNSQTGPSQLHAMRPGEMVIPINKAKDYLG